MIPASYNLDDAIYIAYGAILAVHIQAAAHSKKVKEE